ncbi:MAG: nucleotidyltransferase domain-containing protein [Candidatus Moranbacteria bacterium]|nr:nucleotidyltransferase domain-containing protein [Candidatus Moranbacteria bacterium]
MSKVKGKAEAKKLVNKYVKQLKEAQYPFKSVYLFGSYAKNKAHKWSDIDVAVITNQVKNYNEKNRLKLWELRNNVDLRIQPISFTEKDFKDINDPMVWEVKTTGEKVA